jgi:hypothetical protein
MADSYTCAHCGGTFDKTWSDEEALQETARDFSPGEIAAEGLAVLCDDCHIAFKAWLAAHPEVRIN